MNITKITKNNFENEVIKSNIPVLIDFWSERCAPCMMLSPVIDELSGELSDAVKVCKLNVDEEQELAIQFGIMSIPTLVAIKDGKIIKSLVGVRSKTEIKGMFGL